MFFCYTCKEHYRMPTGKRQIAFAAVPADQASTAETDIVGPVSEVRLGRSIAQRICGAS